MHQVPHSVHPLDSPSPPFLQSWEKLYLSYLTQVTVSGAEDVHNLKNTLRMVEGITDVTVLPSDSLVRVSFDSSTVGVRQVLNIIKVFLHSKCIHETVHLRLHTCTCICMYIVDMFNGISNCYVHVYTYTILI